MDIFLNSMNSINPQIVDELTRTQECSLWTFRKAIPETCFAISPRQSWGTLARILLTLSLFIFLETKLDGPILLLIWFFHGQAMVGLFVLAHECGHGSFSKSRRMNSFIGHLAFSPLGNGLVTWKLTHDHHHAHTQLRGQEVDWSSWLKTRKEFSETTWRKDFMTRLGYLLPMGILSWVGWNAIRRGMYKNKIMNRPLTPKEARAVTLSNLFMFLIMGLIYLLLWKFTGIWGVLKYHAIPATIAMVTGYLLLIIQHANPESLWYEDKSWTPVRGQLATTFDIRFPGIFEWLWLNINIHIPHHIAPRIPWYHLPEAQKNLIKTYPEFYQQRKFEWRELSWMIRTPYLEYIEEKNYYRFNAHSSDKHTS